MKKGLIAVLLLIVSATVVLLSRSASAQEPVAGPAISIEKYTNGLSADKAPGPYIPVGDSVNWSYRVMNTGNVTLTDITVIDDQGVTVACPETTLEPQGSMICTASGIAVAGQYRNVGTVTANHNGGSVSANDTSHYFGATTGISIEKLTNGENVTTAPGPYILVGDTVTWDYLVRNTGNVVLTGITVTDDDGIAPQYVNGDDGDGALENGETWIYQANGTAKAGQYSNTANVTGTPPGGLDPVSANDTSYYFGATPGISIEKYTNGENVTDGHGPYVLVGGNVTWKYVVNNIGNVVLNSVNITDDQGVIPVYVSGDDGDKILEDGETWIYEAHGAAVAGQYTNTVNVTGKPPGELVVVSASTTSYYFGVDPGISIKKYTNGQDADTAPGPYIIVGENVTWTYNVTNSGNVPLTGVNVTDDRGIIVTFPKRTLVPGESMTCTASAQAEVGQYQNIGTATGQYNIGNVWGNVSGSVSDNDTSHYFGAIPGISIEKHTNGENVTAAPGPYIFVGGNVTWEYLVGNTGNVVLTGITVTDNQSVVLVYVSGDDGDEILEDNETWTFEAQGTATAGQYTNTANVTGKPPGELATVSANATSYYFGVDPHISIKKYTNGQDADIAPGPYVTVGASVAWTYIVTNSGNVLLNGVNVTDNRGVVVTCPKNTLEPGESMTGTASGLAAAGQYENMGTVIGQYNIGSLSGNVSDSDLSHYYGDTPTTPPSGGGGSGGGGGYNPAGPGITNITIYTNNEGMFNIEGGAKSDDGLAWLTFAKGVRATAKSGGALRSVSIVPLEETPPAPDKANIVTLAYEFGPAGAVFTPAVSLTITYNPAILSTGFDESKLVIAVWNATTGQWDEIADTVVDASADTATVMVDHFSAYTVVGYLSPALCTVQGVNVSPQQAETGETVTIRVLVVNSGDLPGSYTVTLKVDDKTEATRNIEVVGNSENTIIFEVTRDAPGSYKVDVNNMIATFTVRVPSGPAQFTVGKPVISPPEIDIGGEVTISVVVENNGDFSGTYKVSLKIDGAIAGVRQVEIAPHTSETVDFITSTGSPGTFAVDVNGQTGSYTVRPFAKAPKTSHANWWLVGGIVTLFFAAALFGWMIYKRRET